MKTSILLLFPSLGKGMSLKCFHLSLICRQMMGFIQPQMLLDVFDTMTVSTRPSTLSKPISMVADIKFTFWPIATLIITKKKKTLIITFSFPQSNPLFLYHILVNIRRITAFVQETEKSLSPHVSEFTEQYARQYSSLHVRVLFHTYWTCFPQSWAYQPSPR